MVQDGRQRRGVHVDVTLLRMVHVEIGLQARELRLLLRLGADGRLLPLRQLVEGPHHVVSTVLAQMVLIRAVLPQLVVQLLRVHCADARLLRRRHLGPHVFPEVRRVEDVPAVGVHGTALVPLERLAILQPLVQGELGARLLQCLRRRQPLLQNIPIHVLVRDK